MQADLYEKKLVAEGCECDANGVLHTGALLRWVQQISTDHCTALGLGDDDYARTHTSFLLAKMSAEFYSPVRAGDLVTLMTRPAAPQRAVYCRYTQLCNAAGETLAAVDARWVLVDTDNWRILRRPPEAFQCPFGAQDVPQLDVKLEKAQEMTALWPERATYARCDQNRHLNNTCYADIVCDGVPMAEMAANFVKRFAIVYHKEVPMGESFLLRRGRTARDTYYFTGESDAGQHFEAEIALTKEP